MATSLQEPQAVRCAAPWQSVMVEGNGTAQPCAYRGNYGNPAIHPPLGNVNDMSLEEIWNGEEIQKLRRWMYEGDLEAAGCAGCLALRQNQPLGISYDPAIDEDDAPDTAYRRNVHLKRKEVEQGATIIKSKPTVLYITPTHRCNLRCTHCYETPTRSDTIRRKGFQEEVEDLLPTLSEIVPGGGEPLVLSFWRRLFDDKSNAINPHLRVSFTTGAHHVDDRVFASMERFSDTQIMVSFDAPDRETFEAIRVNARFDKVVQNLIRFRDVASRKRDGATVMHISVMKQNIRLLPELIRLAGALEVPINFQPVVAYPIDHSLRGFQFGPAEAHGWDDALDEAETLIETVLLPSLRAASRRLGRSFDEATTATLRHHVSALRSLIPWHIIARRHVLITSKVAPWSAPYHKFLQDFALKPQHSRQKMNVVFYPMIDGAVGEAFHYAPINKDGSFYAVLPPGTYTVVLVRRDNLHIAYNGWGLDVPDQESGPNPLIVEPYLLDV